MIPILSSIKLVTISLTPKRQNWFICSVHLFLCWPLLLQVQASERLNKMTKYIFYVIMVLEIWKMAHVMAERMTSTLESFWWRYQKYLWCCEILIRAIPLDSIVEVLTNCSSGWIRPLSSWLMTQKLYTFWRWSYLILHIILSYTVFNTDYDATCMFVS